MKPSLMNRPGHPASPAHPCPSPRPPRAAGLLAALIGLTGSALALDPPHQPAGGTDCTGCHQIHYIYGIAFTVQQGSDNSCLSCHQPGGVAASHAFVMSDQASLYYGSGSSLITTGTSHRWDSSPSGRVVSVNGSDETRLTPGGTYTGLYRQVYTFTIETGGTRGTATFSWHGSDVGDPVTTTTTGTDVPLENGLTVTFEDTTYLAGTQWQIRVLPDLVHPSNPDLTAVMPDGQAVCVTCHQPHQQTHTPFDPNAPVTPGSDGRHLMRMDTDTDQLCQECHAPRFVTDAANGSHPVGVAVPTVSGVMSPPSSLPLDKTEGKLRCSTCHQVHHSPQTNGGELLRKPGLAALCTECHDNVAGDPAHGSTMTCSNCHRAHGWPDRANPSTDYPDLLIDHAEDLCTSCHNTPLDVDTATPALHLDRVSGPAWPGGQYGSNLPADTNGDYRGTCYTCHRPHGWPDSTGTDYPTLLVEDRQNQELCLTCHDGSPASADLGAEFAKTYAHNGTDCSACHNVHKLTAAEPLRGTERISVQNVSTTTVNYTYHGPRDTAGAQHYEVCFSCHSAGATLAGNTLAGTVDLSLKLNTQNPGYHPVEATGQNPGINANTFVNGWSDTSTMDCTDCHGSDTGAVAGLHGSGEEHILKAPYLTSVGFLDDHLNPAIPNTWLCFDCHSYTVYANAQNDQTANLSRFGKDGHKKHVASKQYPCYACHDTHGAPDLPNLLVARASAHASDTQEDPNATPGLIAYYYNSNKQKWGCTATCHGWSDKTSSYKFEGYTKSYN